MQGFDLSNPDEEKTQCRGDMEFLMDVSLHKVVFVIPFLLIFSNKYLKLIIFDKFLRKRTEIRWINFCFTYARDFFPP